MIELIGYIVNVCLRRICANPFVQRCKLKRKMNPTNDSWDQDNLNALFREPISAGMYSYLQVAFNLILIPFLGLAGTLFNIINLIVFYKMGLSDGVTRNFFILALSYGLFATNTFINKILLILRTVVRIYIGYGRKALVIHHTYHFRYFSMSYLQNYSLITTFVISVVR